MWSYMGPAGAHDNDTEFMGLDLRAGVPSMVRSFRWHAVAVLLTEVVACVLWVGLASWNYKLLAFFTWVAASFYAVRIAFVCTSILFITHPYRIDTFSLEPDAETAAARNLRLVGLTTPFVPMQFYGMFVRVLHPALIIVTLVAEATLLFLFPSTSLLLLNALLGLGVVVQGNISYYVWRLGGVVIPRLTWMRIVQESRIRLTV